MKSTGFILFKELISITREKGKKFLGEIPCKRY
jgi:hypothetical protein